MEEIKRALWEIENEKGFLDPQTVIDRAEDPASPLHGQFEWHDDIAAKAYRLGQARKLILSVRVEVTVRDVPMNVVGYVKVDREYQNIARVQTDADRSREVVTAEMKRVISAAHRARSIAAYLGTADDVEEIVRLASAIINRARTPIRPDDPTAGSA